MQNNGWHKPFGEKIITESPNDRNGFELFKGRWKYDYETMSVVDVVKSAEKIGIPRLCSETFEGFGNFDILELGPADGYHSFLLEKNGARSVLSIEGNIESFLKCLVMKNALSMRTKYVLGDFTKYLFQQDVHADLIFASGVLYHLTDPIEFLVRCGEVAQHIYIWTFVYDADAIDANPYERRRFIRDVAQQKTIRGANFDYFERLYEPIILGSAKFAGGLYPSAHWLDKETLFRAVELAGYEVVRTFNDDFGGIPAVNILAFRR